MTAGSTIPGIGGDFDMKDQEGYRLALRWQPLDNLLFDYVFDYATQHGTPDYSQRAYDYPPQDYPGVTDTSPLQPFAHSRDACPS